MRFITETKNMVCRVRVGLEWEEEEEMEILQSSYAPKGGGLSIVLDT